MKISLISDTHFEFHTDPTLFLNKDNVDVLVIAGDLAVGSSNIIHSLERFSKSFKDIVYVLGNHESYGAYLTEISKSIKEATNNTNVHFLDSDYVIIDDVVFFGSTLWTNFRKDAMAQFACARGINDFRRIKGFNTDYCSLLHTEQIKYIKDTYSKFSEYKKVIVTHFLPAVECIAPQYRGPDLLNYYFANDYGDWISELKDTTIMFGHTHDKIDVTIGDTRCVCNPYGYYYNKNYNNLIIEV